MNDPGTTVILVERVQVALLAVGVLLWMVALARGRALEWFAGPSRLPPWVAMLSEFLVFALAVCVASIAFSQLAIALFHIDMEITPVPARTALVIGFAMQIAWLAVAWGFHLQGMIRPRPSDTGIPAAIVGGVGALLLALPAVTGASAVWSWLLKTLHVTVEPQNAINFVREADTLAELLPWVLLVVVIVPVAEELLFRRALYRFLSAHMPDWVAIVASSLVFAFMHGNLLSVVPLTVLGIAFCLAYRQTGRLMTPIVMHALFNLASLVQARLTAAP